MSSLPCFSCYSSEITQVSLISHSFALIPSLSTTFSSTPSGCLCVLIYLCTCHKKPSHNQYFTPSGNSREPRETIISRGGEQTSHHRERPTGVLPTCRAPGCQSAHITSSIHQCLLAFVLPVSLSPSSRISKVEFSQLMNFPQVRRSQVCVNAVPDFTSRHTEGEKEQRLTRHMLQRKDPAVFVLQPFIEFISFPFWMVAYRQIKKSILCLN